MQNLPILSGLTPPPVQRGNPGTNAPEAPKAKDSTSFGKALEREMKGKDEPQKAAHSGAGNAPDKALEAREASPPEAKGTDTKDGTETRDRAEAGEGTETKDCNEPWGRAETKDGAEIVGQASAAEAAAPQPVDLTALLPGLVAPPQAQPATDAPEVDALRDAPALVESRSAEELPFVPTDAQRIGALATKPEPALKPDLAAKPEAAQQPDFTIPVTADNPGKPVLEAPSQPSAPAQAMLTALAAERISAPAAAQSGFRLEPRLGTAGWDNALGQKVLWMVSQQQQVAEMHLNPPDLGPMQVVLSVGNDQASAQFFSPHADVRQAIEAALPRLKEMMADSGIALGNATVGEHESQQHSGYPRRGGFSPGPRTGRSPEALAPLATSRLPGGARNGLVDIFA